MGRRLGQGAVGAGTVAAATCLFAAWSAWRYPGAGHDDVFIFIWSGETLGSGPWFVNFNFRPEEMVSSVLVPLVAAALHALSPDGTFLLLKLAGLLAGAAVVPALWRSRSAFFGREGAAPAALMAVAATVLSPPLQYWACGGMETPYQGLGLALLPPAYAAHLRGRRNASAAALAALLSALVLTRTEGFWPALLAAALLTVARRPRLPERRDAAACGAPLALFLLLLVARRAATGSAWPNPVLAKIGSLQEALPAGLAYLGGYYASSPLAWAQALALALAAVLLGRDLLRALRGGGGPTLPPAVAMAAAVVLAQDLFVLAVGGNWMPFYRFLAPTVPLHNVLLAWAALGAWRRAAARLPAPRPGLAAGAAALAAALVLSQARLRTENPLYPPIGNSSGRLSADFFGGGIPAMNRRLLRLSQFHREDLEETLPFIRGPLRELVARYGSVTVLSEHAGLFPYMIRRAFTPDEVWFVDVLGLADRDVARLEVPKNHWGNLLRPSLRGIYEGRAGEASARLAAPQLFYLRTADAAVMELTGRLGFREIWSRPHSHVFLRPAAPAAKD